MTATNVRRSAAIAPGVSTMRFPAGPLCGSVVVDVCASALSAWRDRVPDGSWLAVAEEAQLQGMSDRRAADWLAGRLAAKVLATELFDVADLREVTVAVGIGDRRVLQARAHNVSVSIAHSQGRAVAASSSRGHVGVDVELATDLAGIERFVLGERREGEPLPDADLAAEWMVREATVKAGGWGLGLHLRRISTTWSGRRDGPVRIDVPTHRATGHGWVDTANRLALVVLLLDGCPCCPRSPLACLSPPEPA